MILAIDLGSTSFKAAVFDAKLQETGFGAHRLQHRFEAGGRVEFDVAVVEAAVRGALRTAVARNHEIEAVAITSQAQTFTMLDEHGAAQGPFISWQDCRATAACEALRRKLPDFGAHTSFGTLVPCHQLCQIRHLRPSRRLRPVALPSYVLMLLTGATVTDANLAAMSGLYSLPLKGWWPEALQACGLCEQQLPAVIPIGETAALTTSAARRFGLKAGIPVILAGNDQTAGGYAARLDEKESLLITMGTAQVAYACYRRMPPPREGTIRGPYPGGLSYRMAADSCGGSVINWAEALLAGCADDDTFFGEAATSPRGCHGLVFEAGLDAGQGAWTNLGFHHTRADLARSVLESLSLRMGGLVDRLGVSLKGRPVLAAGGGSLRPLWRSMVSEILGSRISPTLANPLTGAARMAMNQRPANA